MSKSFLLIGAILGAISVVLGAFAAHGLRKIVPPESVTTFETGVRYQFYHTFALLILAILMERFPGSLMNWAGYCFIIGILLFSGSLYLLAVLRTSETVGVNSVGLITPIGGLFFIAGWILLFFGILKKS
jgi:uncharacterized membrane protein YgdD (TMEM256/DUF423 family)